MTTRILVVALQGGAMAMEADLELAVDAFRQELVRTHGKAFTVTIKQVQVLANPHQTMTGVMSLRAFVLVEMRTT